MRRHQIWPGSPISDYSHAQLVVLIRWIKSDDVVRTDEEIFDQAMKELGYLRRGHKILVALQAAIADA